MSGLSLRGIATAARYMATASQKGSRGMNFWWGAAAPRCFSAGSRPDAPTPPGFFGHKASADTLKEPAFVRGLEKKTLDELENLHVDAVDDDEEMIVVNGKHTFSWKVFNSQAPLGGLGAAQIENPASWWVCARLAPASRKIPLNDTCT